METATIIVILCQVYSLELPHILSIQLLTRFENLRDPFEEHDKKNHIKNGFFLRIQELL
jgi:hypothetical protein